MSLGLVYNLLMSLGLVYNLLLSLGLVYNLLMSLGLVYNLLMSLGLVYTTLHLSEDFCTMMPLPWSKDVHAPRHTHKPSPTLGTHLECSLALEFLHTCTMLSHPGMYAHMYNTLSSWNFCTHVQCLHTGTSVHRPTADLQWNFCAHAHHSFSNFCTLVQCSITLKCHTHVQCSLTLEFKKQLMSGYHVFSSQAEHGNGVKD